MKKEINLFVVSSILLIQFVASCSSRGHSALGSEGPEFESWFHQVDVESLGKALYMHSLTALRCKMSTRLCDSEALTIWLLLCIAPLGVEKGIGLFGWLLPDGEPLSALRAL